MTSSQTSQYAFRYYDFLNVIIRFKTLLEIAWRTMKLQNKLRSPESRKITIKQSKYGNN